MSKNQARQTKRKKSDWRHLFAAGLALLLALALVLPLLGSLSGMAGAVSQSELKGQISSLKGDAASASSKKKELEDQLKAIQNDKAQVMAKKNILDQQLYALESEISNTQGQIDAYAALIVQQEEALAQAQAEEQAAYETFCARARAMEEAGDISYLSVVFQASSFTDLLDRLAMVDEIVAYDNSVVEDLSAARQAVERTLAELNESKAGLEEQKAALDQRKAEQEAKIDEIEAVLADLRGQAQHAEALVAAQEAEEKKIAAEIAKKEKELQKLIEAQQIKFTTGSGYVYPLPSGNTRITSVFGWRTHPITGKPNNHTGVDIAAPGGTNIYAVQGGVVVTSAYAPSSYGEYVVINHGNGMTTLYAHMQRGTRKVKEGDIVSQGQIIGLVGMTGSATGNHLHLELRINGVRQNAVQLFPGVNFTYPD